MTKKIENILLIAGSGQNVGKTTLASQIIKNVGEKNPVAVKITPHFHQPTPGLIEIERGKNWILFEETNKTTQKDSSLYLQNGAKKSFLIQVGDEGLQEAFFEIKKILPSEAPIVIESAALIEIIDPGLFIVVLPDGECQKKEIEPILHKANLIVISDGKRFYPSPDKIHFKNTWYLR